MAITCIFKVHYHFTSGGKKVSPDYIDYVSAAAGDYATLKGVMSSNNLLRGGNTLEITSVQNIGVGAYS
jgi:hypothetical protein